MHYSPRSQFLNQMMHSASYSTFNQLNTYYCPACKSAVPVAASFQSLLFSLSIVPVTHAAKTRCSIGATASFKIRLAQIAVHNKLTSMTHRTTAFRLAVITQCRPMSMAHQHHRHRPLFVTAGRTVRHSKCTTSRPVLGPTQTPVYTGALYRR